MSDPLLRIVHIVNQIGRAGSPSRSGALIRIDPTTNTVIDGIPPGGIPDSIAAGLGAVWVTDLERQALIRLDPRSNTVADRIELGSRPTSVALAGGLVWVAVI